MKRGTSFLKRSTPFAKLVGADRCVCPWLHAAWVANSVLWQNYITFFKKEVPAHLQKLGDKELAFARRQILQQSSTLIVHLYFLQVVLSVLF